MSILRSPFEPLPVPDVALHRQFFEHFKEHADRIALVNDVTGAELTYGKVLDLCQRVACGLVKLGVKKGDVFALYSFNTPELIIMMWAVFCTGATVTSVNPLHTAYELQDQLLEADAAFIFTTSDLLGTAQESLKRLNKIKQVIVDGMPEHTADVISFVALSQNDKSFWKYLERLDFHPREDVLILLYSSGTTGKPKGVPLTHHNVLYNSIQRRHPMCTGPTTEICTLVTSPLYHAYAFAMFVVGHMAEGAKLVIQKKFDVPEFIEAIDKHRVTHLYLVSSFVVRLAKSTLCADYDISSIQHVYSTGATLNQETKDAFFSKMGVKHINQVYGMSEASIVTVQSYTEQSPDGAAGVLVPGLEACIIDPSTGEQLDSPEQGEVCIRGPQLMNAYLNPAASDQAAARDSKGWLHTGDLGYFDENRFLYIVDRLKDIFKVYNNQVSPTQLEGVLFNHPAVLDVGVVGIPDEIAINKPKAFVVKKPDADVTEKELCDYVAGNLFHKVGAA